MVEFSVSFSCPSLPLCGVRYEDRTVQVIIHCFLSSLSVFALHHITGERSSQDSTRQSLLYCLFSRVQFEQLKVRYIPSLSTVYYFVLYTLNLH